MSANAELVAPESSSNQSAVNDTCSTSSSTLKRPLSPRSRLQQFALRRGMDQNGLASASLEAERPAPTKIRKATVKFSKQRFVDLLTSLEVVNGQQYEVCLVENSELRSLERCMQPNQIEPTKKLSLPALILRFVVLFTIYCCIIYYLLFVVLFTIYCCIIYYLRFVVLFTIYVLLYYLLFTFCCIIYYLRFFSLLICNPGH